MKLRPYQRAAIDAIFEAWQRNNSALLTMATGLGKTVTFAGIIDRVVIGGSRALVIAHREELIFQAADKIESVTGHRPDIEMADLVADVVGLHGKARVVVASVQTLNAGNGTLRVAKFEPSEFDLIVIDEAHHATAESYRRVIEHFRGNPDIKLLGVTATPDRTDKEALGQIFDAAPFSYDIADAVRDGWLVPIMQRAVMVDGLDLTTIRTTAGDLNGADLARVMEYEQNLHEIASPTIEIVGDRKTLIFAASLAHAERLTEILNRHKAGSARWVHGGTPKEVRREMFRDYAARKFQYLCNVGVATEGFDDPAIECVVMARPTKSRSLYAQMAGRGTRPLPGVVDQPDDTNLFDHEWTAEVRRQRIAESAKPGVEIIDFVGNSGKHKLVTAADILGGAYTLAAIERAKQKAAQGRARDVQEALDEAQSELDAEKERQIKEAERAKQEEIARRAKLAIKARYSLSTVDPFDVLHLAPARDFGWEKTAPATDKQLAFLEKQGIDASSLSRSDAGRLIGEIKSRWANGRCSFKQARALEKRGVDTSNLTRSEASKLLDQIASKEGWGKKKSPANAQPVAVPEVGDVITVY